MRSQRERSARFLLNKPLALFEIVALASILVALGGCDDGSEGATEAHLSFTGLVTSVETRSLLEFESITVASESGVVLDFHAGGRRFEEFTPAHVREHMVLGDPVEVTYQKSGDMLLIVSLRDASAELPAPSGSP